MATKTPPLTRDFIRTRNVIRTCGRQLEDVINNLHAEVMGEPCAHDVVRLIAPRLMIKTLDCLEERRCATSVDTQAMRFLIAKELG